MNESCIPVGELARIVALPAGDPGRRHLDACTRCQALAAMLGGFESPGGRPTEAGFEAADARLLATIAELTGIPAAEADGAPARAGIPARRGGGSWWRLPQLRLAGAFAALVLVSVAGVALWQARTPAPVMRALPRQGVTDFASAAPREVAGGIELGWSALPEAETYRVIFLDDSLREIARLAPTRATTARLEVTALPAGLAHGATIGWQVEALAGGDRVRVTATRALRVP